MAEQIGLEGVFDMSSFDKGISSYLTKLKQAEDNTQQTSNSFGSAFDTMGKKVLDTSILIGKTFVAATAAATEAIGAFVIGGISQASELESQMGSIAAIMGESKDAIAPLKELITDLGLDPALKVNAQEAADAIEKLASNGLSMTQIMEGAARNTVLLANSTGADFDTAAAIATDTMALFNIEASDMMEAINGITGVTVASKFEINDYRLALSQAGGVASATGVEFDDFNTAITGISNYFASGSDAGTSFKTMLLRLVPASDAASEMMAKIGLTTFNTESALKLLTIHGVKPLGTSMNDLWGELYNVWAQGHKTEAASDTAAKKFNEWTRETGLVTNAFFNANGEMKSMSDISALLNDSLKDLSEEEKSKALNTIFGTDAMRAAVGIAEQGEVVYTDQAKAAEALGVSFESLNSVMEGGITKFEALQIQIQNTDAAEAAKVRMDNLKGSLEILQGVIDTVALEIGFAFLPLLKQLADKASELASQYAPGIIAFFESFAAGIENVLSTGNWSALFPDWLNGIITLVSNNLDLLLGALGGVAALLAGAGIAAAFTAIGTAMAAVLSPLGLLIIGAAALGAAWNTNFLGIKDATFAVIEPIQSFISAVVSAGARSTEAQEALGLFPEFLQGFIGGLATTVENILSYISAIQDAGVFSTAAREALTLFPEVLQGLIQGIVETIASIGNYIGAIQSAGLFSTEAREALGLLLASFWTLIGGVGTLLGSWTTTLASWASAVTEQLMAIDYYALGVSILTFIKDGWIATVATVMPTLTAFGTELGLKLRSVDWAGIGTAILNLIEDGWTSITATVITTLSGFGTELALKIRTIDWKSVGSAILNFIKEGWTSVISTMSTVVTNWTTSVKTIITSVDWQSIGSTILNTIKEGWEAVKSTALLALSAIASTWKLQFGDAVQNWTQVGKDTLDKLKSGIEAAKTTILTTITNVATDMKNRYMTPEGFQWNTLGQDVANLIRDGFQAATKAAGGLIALALTVATSVKNQFTEMSWAEIGTLINQLIKTALETAVKGAEGLLATAKKLAGDVMSGITEIDWGEVGRSIARGIKDGFKAIVEGIGGLLPTAKASGESMKSAFTSIDWLEVGKSIVNAILTGVKAIAYAAAGLIFIAAEIAKGFSEEMLGVDWDKVGQDIIGFIQQGIETAKTTFMALIATIPTEIQKIFTDTIDKFKSIGADIVNGIGAGITGAKDSLIEKAKGLANSLPEWVRSVLGISSPSKVFMVIGSQVIEGLIIGLSSSLPALQSTLGRITSTLTSAQLMAAEFTATSTFTDMLEESYLEPLKNTVTAINRRRDELVTAIAGINLELTRPGIDATRQSDLLTWLRLANQELATLNRNTQGQQLANLQSVLQWSNHAQDNVSFLESQLELIKTAKSLGIDVSGIVTGATDVENVTQMANIERRIAEIKRNQLYTQINTIKATTQQLNQYEGWIQAIQHVETYNDFLNEQLSMMKQAESLGLDLSKLWAGGIIRDPNDTARLLDLQLKIASATGASLENELNGMVAEQKRIRGLESALQVLQPLIDQTNVSSVFGQRYKATVVDPLLRALEKAAGIDSERVRLMNEYTAAAQKLAEINRKEEQLNFLNQQLDVIKMIQDQDLVGGNSLFEGLALGVNASIDDLLLLTNRVLNSMIEEVNDELGIHSPSTVFAEIGEQMMAGLGQGIKRAITGPLASLREATVAQGAVSARTLNFNMGGVSIYTPMDEVMFENRVLRIIERSI